MKISIIAVGKIKEKYLREGIEEFKKRLSRYCSLEIIEVLDECAPESLSAALEDKVKKAEAERIVKNIRTGAFVICMEVNGERMSSEAFAAKIENLGVNGISNICIVIGGSLGIHHSVLGLANMKLSMSDMTFTHQLARLIILEQVYRAFKIIRGEPYAK